MKIRKPDYQSALQEVTLPVDTLLGTRMRSSMEFDSSAKGFKHQKTRPYRLLL